MALRMSSDDGIAAIDIRFDWNIPLDGPLDDDFRRFANASPAVGNPFSSESFEPLPVGACRSSYSPQPLMEHLEEEHEELDGGIEVSNSLKRSRFSLDHGTNKSLLPSRRKKKIKSLPKRPLSAYNFFFQQERTELMIGNAKISVKVGFEDLGRIVGKKWRSLSETQREPFVKLAEKDSERYRMEMKSYREREKSDHIDQDYNKKEPVSSSMPSALSSGKHHPVSFLPPYHEQPMPPPYYRAPPPYSARGASFPMQPFAGSGHGNNGKEMNILSSYPQEAMCAPIPPFGIPLRSFQEVLIPDHNGHLQKYRVQYAVMTMSEAESHEYMKRWTIPMPPHDTSRSYTPPDF